MSSLKKFILEQVAKRAITGEQAKLYLKELGKSSAAKADEIAIIGMAGRFPRAKNADEYWKVLRDGVNCIQDFPEQRKKDFEHILRNKHYTELLIGKAIDPKDIDRVHAKAGYMEEVDKFDAEFFGIPPTEAIFMDPHQRVALEIAWEAMENAGYGGERLIGSNTGIYLGRECTNFSLYRYTTVNNPMKLTGSWESIMVSRISYLFDFKGPCMIVDTACSAGLVSVHMAAQALLNGECETALAGGINLIVSGELNPEFQGAMAMDAVESADGRVRTFDARANGTVWGEGVAMVMLKLLSKALEDRDPIHAIIKGSAINNDGAASGLTAPDAKSQESVIVSAWKKAKINPEDLSYIEAHGTGTVLGDPIELKGLTSAFRQFTDKKQFCALGSLKTNMGHLVGASGVASLFKVVKSLENEQLAPTINFGLPNPYINFLNSPLYVNDRLQNWDRSEKPRIAGLSSFGFSHTNCHMVVQEAPERITNTLTKNSYCFTLSAKNKAVLVDYIKKYQQYFKSNGWSYADVCHTSNLGRGHYTHRLAIICQSGDELVQAINQSLALVEQETSSGDIYYQSHAIVSDKKKQIGSNEITDTTKKSLNKEAENIIDSLKTDVEAHTYANQLHAIVASYIKGADINWSKLYRDEKRQWLSLPTYPFVRNRLWAAPKLTQVADSNHQLHPLVEKLVESSDAKDVFESCFSATRHWVLSDHKIKGSYVVPGTTYLEIIRAAARLSTHASREWLGIAFKNCFFLSQMIVEEKEERRVRITIHKADTKLTFEIESFNAGADEWIRHVEGALIAAANNNDSKFDIESLKSGFEEFIEEFEAETDTGVFQFGIHWDTIRSVWLNADKTKALARLVLPEALADELSTYKLHPSVLDNAVNLISQTSGDTFLPFMYKTFEVYRAFTCPMYSYVVENIQKRSVETRTFDVKLFSESGELIASATDYFVKKVNGFENLQVSYSAQEEFLDVGWQELDPEAPAAKVELPKSILVVDASIYSNTASKEKFLKVLDEANIAVRYCAIDDLLNDKSVLTKNLNQTIDSLVITLFDEDSIAPSRFAEQRKKQLDGLFHLSKQLLDLKARFNHGIALLTHNAFQVNRKEQPLNALAAAASAFMSVIGVEYDHLPVRLLDVHAEAINALLPQRLFQLNFGKQYALRDNSLLIRELSPLDISTDENSDLSFIKNGAAVITGGLGGLGLATADYLANIGCRKIVLIGRRELQPRETWAINAADKSTENAVLYQRLVSLAERIDTLDYVCCDLANVESVNSCFKAIREKIESIGTVFHLAGAAGDGFIMRKSFEQFDNVVTPKVNALKNLFDETEKDALNLFVCFSSIVSLTGGEGQGDYAAANAFMDAVMVHGREKGRQCLSINWPSWKEIGMAADYAVDDAHTPFNSLSPNVAFEKLTRLMIASRTTGLTQVLPSAVNVEPMARFMKQLPFVLAHSLQTKIDSINIEADGGANLSGVDLIILGKDENDLTANEKVLAHMYASVLGLSEIDIYTNFHDMGGNSIIATHLLKLINLEFNDLVDVSDIFSYSSITRYRCIIY